MNRLITMNGESPRSIRAGRSMLLLGVSPQKNGRRAASEKMEGVPPNLLFISKLKKRDALDTICSAVTLSFRIHSGRFVIQFVIMNQKMQEKLFTFIDSAIIKRGGGLLVLLVIITRNNNVNVNVSFSQSRFKNQFMMFKPQHKIFFLFLV